MKSILQLVVVTMALASLSVEAKLRGQNLEQNADDVNGNRKLDTFWVVTPSPTTSPTPSPTETPTDSPTPSPTAAPTTSPTPAPTKSPTPAPTPGPTEQPSISTPSPTGSPSVPVTMTPTMCKESYLTAENLNIALVVDLSFSTFEKKFSSEVDVGDVNGDGGDNTILDAQILAIQDLLVAIADSPTLNNVNCEIELIGFHTDAYDLGVWAPLSADGTSFNPDLMNYIKTDLRAPTSKMEIFQTNNGYTNFDAALDAVVAYFTDVATPERNNLMVFLSDGEPNVRGDGDNEQFCNATTTFWGDGPDSEIIYDCADVGDVDFEAGDEHTICTADDPDCIAHEQLQDCVRGPNLCLNAEATTQYTSELNALDELEVERIAIGVGDESNVTTGSALWMIDNNPSKDLGVLPLQALNLEELTVYLSSLCILTTEKPSSAPTGTPTASPTKAPTGSPSASPTSTPTKEPTLSPTPAPTNEPTADPTAAPTNEPTADPTTAAPTTAEPTASPTDPLVPLGDDDITDDKYFPPVGPDECPEDLLLVKHVGVKEYPHDAVQIIEQETDFVTVQINQAYSETEISHFYYQYDVDHFNNKCYEEQEWTLDEPIKITIQCTVSTGIALLELWVADESFSSGNDAVIPNCCHPTVPEGYPVTKYMLEIKCVSACPEDIA
jgi:hypothetical protein